MTRLVVLALVCLAGCGARSAGERPPQRPDLSGYWMLSRAAPPPDETILKTLPPNTVLLKDTGATELALGDFGGLEVKPEALAAARAWRPEDEMTVSRVCVPPSIVYAMQGPFPMEIYQGTELIVFKLEYYDLVRIVFMDGRPHPPDAPHSKVGHSIGWWEDSTLVVDTTHLSSATITNNGLNHSDDVHVIERFTLSEDGRFLTAVQEFEDPDVLENRGARYIVWQREPGQYVFPYECDPSFGANYQP